MPVTSSGEIKLRADVNDEINGNDSDSNVSLRSLSSSAGLSEPDALSEFYGYSSVTTPTLTYNSISSNYSTFTPTYTVNWGGASGSYQLTCEVYASSSLGGGLYFTQTVQSGSGPPSGNQSVSFTVTPTSQYANNDQNYQIIVKATNSEGTVSEPGSGKRSVSIQASTQYTFKNYHYYHCSTGSGLEKYNATGNLANGSYVEEQFYHPQMGWVTSHKTNWDGSNVSGVVGAPGLTYNGNSSMYNISMAYRSGSTFVHKHAVENGASQYNGLHDMRYNTNMIYSNCTFSQGYNNALGFGYNNASCSPPYDWRWYDHLNDNIVSSPTNVYAIHKHGGYNASGSHNNWSGHKWYWMSQSSGNHSNQTVTHTTTTYHAGSSGAY